MEEGPVRQGLLHLQQQQTFGKKWKKVWALLYGKNTFSVARLELVDGSNLPDKVKKSENKKVIKLSDCVRVSEANAESCPRGTCSFLLETTDRMYLLAAESTEQESWIGQLCELAFPMRKESLMPGKEMPLKPSHLNPPSICVTMEENSLYNMSVTDPKVFEVTVRSTEASERCHLRGTYTLKAQKDALGLWHRESGNALYTWPYMFLRRFGRDKVMFSFEAGRRCASGEGNFEFETRQGSEIFLAIETAISAQKTESHGEPSWGGSHNDTYRHLAVTGHQRLDMKSNDHSYTSDKGEPLGINYHTVGARSLSLGRGRESKPLSQKCQPSKTLQPTKNTSGHLPLSAYSECSDLVSHAEQPVGVKSQDHLSSKLTESEYAIPFDTIAKSLMTINFGSLHLAQPDQDITDPLYNSIEEVSVVKAKAPTYQQHKKPEHIYDEPEGRVSHAVYDEPEQVKGEAWKLQATDPDPPGHEYPYNPALDDYAVPSKQTGRLYGRVTRRRVESKEDVLGECEYDNVLVKNSIK